MDKLLGKATSGISSAADSAKKAVRSTLSDATLLGRKAAFTAESKGLEVRDSVLNAASKVTHSAVEFGQSIVGTAFIMAEVGVVVAAVVAPVPTFIGVALLWLLTDQLVAGSAAADAAVRQDQDKRKFVRVTGLLKKYGQIPETATLETKLIQMNIDSTSGEITGSILEGEFKDRDIASLSRDDIDRLIEHAPDEDTRDILKGYRSLMDARSGLGAAHATPAPAETPHC